MSEDKNKVIGDMGEWVEEKREWKFSWRRQFFEWEQEQWVEFKENNSTG